MRVLILPQTTRIGASSRTRIYAFLASLEDANISYKIIPGTTEAQDLAFLQSPTLMNKIVWFWRKAIGRLGSLFILRTYDCVLVQRETFPYFYPFVEILLSFFAKRFIFDFDDAIFVYPKKKTLLKKLLMLVLVLRV